MPTFQFQGRDSQGTLIKGKRSAQSIDSLGAELIKEGIIPIKIEGADKHSSAFSKLKKLSFFKKKISQDSLGLFARQMQTLIKSGVSITLAIRQLAETSQDLILSDALFEIAEKLESGQDLTSSFQEYPDVFPPIVVSMIRVGQNSGHLDDAFNNINQYTELESNAMRQFKSATRYPLMVIITLAVATAIIVGYVIPTFATVFQQANIELPFATRILISFSNIIKTYWLLLILASIIIIIFIHHYLKTAKGHYKWDKFKLKIPIQGPILQKILLLRFAKSFSIVVNSGIPVVEGLNLVADTMGNEYVKDQILSMQADIQRGKTLTQAAAAVTLFTRLELQMLSISEETGELGLMLEQLFEFYKREVEYSIKRVNDLIEPILTVGLAILVLGLALAVYLPMWDMIKLVRA